LETISSGKPDDIASRADGEAMVANEGAAREIELQPGNTAALIALKERSLTTLAWQ
jgi:hypothetical protein